jgi:thioredoxin-like negative regulator of GroEL
MAKPVVDGLEHDLSGTIRFAKVDVTTDAGERIAARFGVTTIPTFVLLDREGRVVYRKVGGRPEVGIVRAEVAKMTDLPR